MSAKGEMDIVLAIRKFWPDFTYPKEAFLGGDSECVTEFYQRFIKEVNENVAALTNDSIDEEVFEGAQAFDPAVGLFCKVARILKKLKLSISLCDLLVSNPKRNLGFMRIASHFLIYLNNSFDLAQNVVNGEMSKVSEAEELILRKRELLQEVSEGAELLSHFKTTLCGLEKELLQLNESYRKMQEDEKADAEEEAEKLKKLEKLNQEISNMECEANLLSNEELELKDSLVTDEEYEALKKVQKSLELEQEKVSVAEADVALDSLMEEREVLTNIVTTLKDLHLDHLFILTAKELAAEKQTKEQNQIQLQDILKTKKSSKKKAKNKLETSHKSLEEIQTIVDSYEKEVFADQEKHRIEYENKEKMCSKQSEKVQTLKEEIAKEEKNIVEIENDEKRLNLAMAIEYNKILQSNKKFCDKFSNWLQTTRNFCQQE